MRYTWFVVAVLGCKDAPRHKEKDIDAVTFRHMLQDREEALQIESIRIDPRNHDDARYEVTLKSTPVRSVAEAEYPGTIIDDIVAARIPYLVGEPGERAENEKLIDMTSLHAAVASDGAKDIERVEIVPLGHDRARYTVVHKLSAIRDVSYGEFPGRMTLEIDRAQIPYSVRAR